MLTTTAFSARLFHEILARSRANADGVPPLSRDQPSVTKNTRATFDVASGRADFDLSPRQNVRRRCPRRDWAISRRVHHSGRVRSPRFGEHNTIVRIEAGGKSEHPRLRTKNILRDLKKNLAKRGVADLITLFAGYSAGCKCHSIARQPCRQHAIEDAHSTRDHLDHLRRRAETHCVTRLVVRQKWFARFHRAHHLFVRFTHAHAADRVTAKSDFNQCLRCPECFRTTVACP
jgi:hypothetical protein